MKRQEPDLSELSDFIPQFAAVLVGGLGSSLGITFLLRRPVGKKILIQTKWWGLGLYATISLGGVATGLFLLIQNLRENPDTFTLPESPLLLLVGLVVGFPFSIPGVFAIWSELRPEKLKAREKKARNASRADRLKFAQDLARQIDEFSDGPRNVKGTLSGDKGKILFFDGELSRNEGDKLVAALRGELKDLGFERVEGDGWWCRI